ncbi:unnamed protein product, partial [Polarella glacialis]
GRMGAILSEPVTAMVVERCTCAHWASAVVTMQGWRRSHEDAHILSECSEGSSGVFAVLDGHGGQTAAEEGAVLLKARLEQLVKRGVLNADDAARQMEDLFIQCDVRLRAHLGAEDRSGSTVVCGVVTMPKPNEYCVHLAHAGDSRAVLCSGGRLVCTEDHKPNREDEQRRIEAAGGTVSQGPLGGGPMRVDGALAVSRAFGDFHFKPAGMAPAKCKVSAVPEVRTVTGCIAGDWLFIACDGVFDVMENDEVRDFVSSRLAGSDGPADGGKIMVDILQHCLDKGSKDNCTALLVQFGPPAGTVKPTRSIELLQGNWERASPEVQSKYVEFFSSHGFEAEAKALQLQAQSSGSGRRGAANGRGAPDKASPGQGQGQAAGRGAGGAAAASAGRDPAAQQTTGARQLATLTRALQAIRSTRAIQTAWRNRQTPADKEGSGGRASGR